MRSAFTFSPFRRFQITNVAVCGLAFEHRTVAEHTKRCIDITVRVHVTANVRCDKAEMRERIADGKFKGLSAGLRDAVRRRSMRDAAAAVLL